MNLVYFQLFSHTQKKHLWGRKLKSRGIKRLPKVTEQTSFWLTQSYGLRPHSGTLSCRLIPTSPPDPAAWGPRASFCFYFSFSFTIHGVSLGWAEGNFKSITGRKTDHREHTWEYTAFLTWSHVSLLRPAPAHVPPRHQLWFSEAGELIPRLSKVFAT